MTVADEKKLEDLQWKAANRQIDGNGQDELDRLTAQIREERNQPDGSESGVVNDANHDGLPESQADKSDSRDDRRARDEDEDRKPRVAGAAGVTKTSNFKG